MNLESLINDANNYYVDEDIAVIYKKPTSLGLDLVGGSRLMLEAQTSPSVPTIAIASVLASIAIALSASSPPLANSAIITPPTY